MNVLENLKYPPEDVGDRSKIENTRMLNLKKANKRTNKVSEIVLEMVISEDSRKITKLGGRRKAVDGPFPQGAPGEAALTDPLAWNNAFTSSLSAPLWPASCYRSRYTSPLLIQICSRRRERARRRRLVPQVIG